MKKTLRLRRLSTPGGQRGRIVVATSFADPIRGAVTCGAAPWLAASLTGDLADTEPLLRVEVGPTTAGLGVEPHGESIADSGLMIAVSFVDRRDTVGGFALVVHRDDATALGVAERAATRWSGMLRSRRLLVADDVPLCAGAQQALQMISDAAGTGRAPVYVVGRPVGLTAHVGPAQAGPVVVDSLDAVPDGAQVVFPAHGVSLVVRAEAAARGLEVVDATCPLVAAAHTDAAAYAARGDRVVVIGRSEHAALPVLISYATDAGLVVRDAAEADALAGLPADRLSFVVDPGMAVEEVMPVVATLRRHYPQLAGHHFEVLCEAASDRVQTIRSVASASELVLILSGTRGDAETAAVIRDARCSSVRLLVITDLADMRLEEIQDVTTVGLVTTLTAPADLESQVVRALSGLGPLTVRRRDMQTRPDVASASGSGRMDGLRVARASLPV